MNPPDLGQHVSQEAAVMDQYADGQGKTDEEQKRLKELEQHLQPARWWLASTAFPLLAGTLGPMASAFSICSLTQGWRMESPEGEVHERDVSDPTWIIAVNGVSLGCAIIVNFVLLMNMARRISFEVAQPIIIIGWYISSILLVSEQAAFSTHMDRPENAGLLFTEGFFYASIAAGLYFVIASLLLVTSYGALRGHYSREYRLTTSQRTLMLQTIAFLAYLLLGSLVYTTIEGWDFPDALYWADFTLLTIGIGDFVPKTHLGRSLLFPFAVGGILILGMIIGSIRALMLEKGKQKLADRMTEKTRRFLIRKALAERSRFHALVPRLNESVQSEEERRKQEFIVMRQVRQIATLERKWISLILSLSVWMMLWLIGAVVFWRSERKEHWTYFEALYFSYTTLLTIGYGDFHPVSTFGKPFFVFWTLLAVPTLTILISNIGDTVVRTIRDLTIFLGELTILPGDKSFGDRVKDIFRVSWRQKFLNEATDSESSERGSERKNEADVAPDERESCPLGATTNAIEADEHKKEELARQRGDVRSESIHHYHYLLFRELQKMIRYATSNVPKEFNYNEWEYYLKLLGADEPPVGFAAGPLPDIAGEDLEDEKLREYKKQRDGEDGMARWSWIDMRNPLVCDKSEAQWLLEALAEVLERELRNASRDYHSQEQEMETEGANEKQESSAGGEDEDGK